MSSDEPFRAAFDPARFDETGRAVLALLRDHLASAQARAIEPVLPRERPNEMCALFPADFPVEGTGDLAAVLARVVEKSTALLSPRCVGHQVAAPLPDAALCDLVASLLNNGMAVYETGPASSAMVLAVLQHLASLVGLPSSAGGVLTSGGSLGNLTALLAARQKKAGFDAWRQGLKSGPPLSILVGESAHYSIARAARILGLGDAGAVAVPCDERMRMRPDALAAAIAAEKKRGRRPIAVVASAGSTTAGAFDPLVPIADLCAEHDLWLHVDGAQGASLALSPTRRRLLAGVERADSLVWDAHKMMLMPALVTAVLFRDAASGSGAFAQEAGYLFEEGGPDDDAWSDIGRRTVECTKRMMSLKLYACLQAYGTAFFARHVDRCCDLAAFLAAEVKRRPALELLVEPECDIVCFRARGLDGGKTAAIRRRILEEGRFYVVSVHRKDGLWLRTTILNPLTTEADLASLLDDVEAHARAFAP